MLIKLYLNEMFNDKNFSFLRQRQEQNGKGEDIKILSHCRNRTESS